MTHTTLPTAPEAITEALTHLFEQGLIPDLKYDRTFEGVEDWAEYVYANVPRFTEDRTVRLICALVENCLWTMAQRAVGHGWEADRQF